MLKKCYISNNNSQLKCVIADVICTGALDGVTSFLRLKDVTNTCKRMQHAGFLSSADFFQNQLF